MINCNSQDESSEAGQIKSYIWANLLTSPESCPMPYRILLSCFLFHTGQNGFSRGGWDSQRGNHILLVDLTTALGALSRAFPESLDLEKALNMHLHVPLKPVCL